MAKTYEALMKEIESLRLEAERLRRHEKQGVIERIREAIGAHGISAAELGLAGRGAAPRAKAPKAGAGKRPAARYSDGAGGTWGGIGKRPQWLRDALAAGRTLDDFRV